MATPNPLERTHSQSPAPMSKKTHVIAGILCTIYGYDELLPETKNVACLWLLNPRLQTQACMEPVAFSTINHWNQRLKQKQDRGESQGLIAISFDQRNHGSREIDPLANQAWNAGNEKHAQDMFSIFHGTSLDTSQLITYLPSYIFPSSDRHISSNLVLGISLGGHAAWHCLFSEPRITTAIIIIGCPDYTRLMSDRARLSKLETWTETTPPGSSFLGSVDFPTSLVKAVERYDPAGMCLGVVSRSEEAFDQAPSPERQRDLVPLLKHCLEGKRIMNLAGAADKLVPYAQAEPYLRWLKRAIGPHGWFKEGQVTLEDIVFDGVGHEMSPDMLQASIRFIEESLESIPAKSRKVASKL
ncbi:hypothetical protein MMC18_001840 [Xylographa bjoerkii]|nr:hypothetical protein [Xylographa bjoerkii]